MKVSPRALLGSVSGREAKLGSAALGSVAVSLGGTTFRLLIQVALARWLGPLSYGRFVVMRGWGGLLARFPNRGYHLALVRWLPHFDRTRQPDAYRALIRQSVTSTMVASVAVTLVAIPASIFVLNDRSATTIVGLTLIIAVSAMQIYRQILQASYRHVLGVTFTELAHPAVFAVLALTLAVAVGRSVSASLLALVLAALVVATGEAIVVHRTLPDAQGEPVGEAAWRDGTTPLFIGQLGIAGLEVSYLLIVGAILGPKEAGIYAVSQRIAVLGRMGNSAVESVIGPQFSRLAADGRDAATEMQRVVDKGIRLSSLFTGAACLAILLGSGLALQAFGPEYGDGRTLLWVLLIGNIVNALSGPTGYLVSMTGSERAYGYVMGGHAVVGASAASLVAWQYDSAIGVALVATVVTISWNTWLVRIGGRKLGVWCIPRPLRTMLRIKGTP